MDVVDQLLRTARNIYLVYLRCQPKALDFLAVLRLLNILTLDARHITTILEDNDTDNSLKVRANQQLSAVNQEIQTAWTLLRSQAPNCVSYLAGFASSQLGVCLISSDDDTSSHINTSTISGTTYKGSSRLQQHKQVSSKGYISKHLNSLTPSLLSSAEMAVGNALILNNHDPNAWIILAHMYLTCAENAAMNSDIDHHPTDKSSIIESIGNKHTKVYKLIDRLTVTTMNVTHSASTPGNFLGNVICKSQPHLIPPTTPTNKGRMTMIDKYVHHLVVTKPMTKPLLLGTLPSPEATAERLARYRELLDLAEQAASTAKRLIHLRSSTSASDGSDANSASVAVGLDRDAWSDLLGTDLLSVERRLSQAGVAM